MGSEIKESTYLEKYIYLHKYNIRNDPNERKNVSIIGIDQEFSW